jgi:hypothetical protein
VYHMYEDDAILREEINEGVVLPAQTLLPSEIPTPISRKEQQSANPMHSCAIRCTPAQSGCASHGNPVNSVAISFNPAFRYNPTQSGILGCGGLEGFICRPNLRKSEQILYPIRIHHNPALPCTPGVGSVLFPPCLYLHGVSTLTPSILFVCVQNVSLVSFVRFR